MNPKVLAWLNAIIAGLATVTGLVGSFTTLFGSTYSAKIVAGSFIAASILAGVVNSVGHSQTASVIAKLKGRGPAVLSFFFAPILVLATILAALSPVHASTGSASTLQAMLDNPHGHYRLIAGVAHRPVSTLVSVPAPTPSLLPAGSVDLATVINGMITKAQTFTLNDLQAALADANAQTPPDTRHAQCWSALIPIVQTGVGNPLPTQLGAAILVQKGFDAQKLVTNGLPDSVVTGCALTLYDLKTDFLKLAALVGVKIAPIP